MANYRIVTIDKAGKLGRHRSFVCDNDDDAIVWANQSLDNTLERRSLRRSPRTTTEYQVLIGGGFEWHVPAASRTQKIQLARCSR
jgi:hypothetical protein